jgi:glycosyltransferase involved in cell wall biosynthesis
LYKKVTLPCAEAVSDRITTVSQFSKRRIVDVLEADPDSVDVIYNGIDDIFLKDSGGRPIDSPDSFLLFVGSNNPRKNISGAVDAFAKYCDECRTKQKFVIVGPENKDIWGNVDINDNIVNLGFLDESELKYVYEEAALFIYPSFYEGFGLPPLEAAACGTPVLVPNEPPFTEIFEPAAAEFVDPHSVKSIETGISNVLTNESRRNKLAERGRRTAKQLTWAKTIDRLLDTFREVTS